ncbi:E3 ubiquitin--protein ligase, partial [Salmonella enterica subsp. arizonae]|nr:E3 ubiquitin--protein ligase [Salmonella enterica subsp. arizonae]
RLTMETEPGEECTEHAEGASGTSCLPATTAPQTAAEYDAVWSAWQRAAPEGEARGRAAVVQEMRDCLNNGNPVLNVGAAGLTTLPDHLPPHITTLIIPDNNLTHLSTLPAGLQELIFAGNQLPSLPALPSGLRELIVVESPLTSLPELPSGLCKLWAFNNQLASLPALPPGLRELSVDGNLLPSLPALPSGLQSLSASHNQMASLPTLPPGLEELSVDDNQLASLPALPLRLQKLSVSHNLLTHLSALPPGLQSLWATNNRLTSLSALPPGLEELVVFDNQLPSLPALPPGLRTLRASNNRLTRLPESITGLSSEATVHLEGNLLSERTLQTMQNLTSAPGYSGPRIRFDMAGPSVPREARALHLAVADWLMPAREGEPDPADRWHTSGQEDNAAAFSLFLDRLRETENFEKDPGFKAQISSWLALLAEDDVLRAKTFAMATEATSSCQDRITLALHQMKNVQLVHNAEKGVYDNNLPGLVSTGREMFRMEMLERIALEKVRTLAFVDEIEVCLAYQNKLKESLELT